MRSLFRRRDEERAGQRFEPSIAVLRLLALIIPVAFLHSILRRVSSALGEQHLVLRVQVVTMVSRVTSSLLLILPLGFLGAAIATPSNYLQPTGLLVCCVRRGATQPKRVHLSWRFACAALVMGTVTWVFSDRLPISFLVPLAAGIYEGLVFALKVFSQDDLVLFCKI